MSVWFPARRFNRGAEPRRWSPARPPSAWVPDFQTNDRTPKIVVQRRHATMINMIPSSFQQHIVRATPLLGATTRWPMRFSSSARTIGWWWFTLSIIGTILVSSDQTAVVSGFTSSSSSSSLLSPRQQHQQQYRSSNPVLLARPITITTTTATNVPIQQTFRSSITRIFSGRNNRDRRKRQQQPNPSSSSLLFSVSPTTLRHSYDDDRSNDDRSTDGDTDNSTFQGSGEYSSSPSSSSILRTLRILDKIQREQHNLEEYQRSFQASSGFYDDVDDDPTIFSMTTSSRSCIYPSVIAEKDATPSNSKENTIQQHFWQSSGFGTGTLADDANMIQRTSSFARTSGFTRPTKTTATLPKSSNDDKTTTTNDDSQQQQQHQQEILELSSEDDNTNNVVEQTTAISMDDDLTQSCNVVVVESSLVDDNNKDANTNNNAWLQRMITIHDDDDMRTTNPQTVFFAEEAATAKQQQSSSSFYNYFIQGMMKEWKKLSQAQVYLKETEHNRIAVVEGSHDQEILPVPEIVTAETVAGTSMIDDVSDSNKVVATRPVLPTTVSSMPVHESAETMASSWVDLLVPSNKEDESIPKNSRILQDLPSTSSIRHQQQIQQYEKEIKDAIVVDPVPDNELFDDSGIILDSKQSDGVNVPVSSPLIYDSNTDDLLSEGRAATPSSDDPIEAPEAVEMSHPTLTSRIASLFSNSPKIKYFLLKVQDGKEKYIQMKGAATSSSLPVATLLEVTAKNKSPGWMVVVDNNTHNSGADNDKEQQQQGNLVPGMINNNNSGSVRDSNDRYAVGLKMTSRSEVVSTDENSTTLTKRKPSYSTINESNPQQFPDREFNDEMSAGPFSNMSGFDDDDEIGMNKVSETRQLDEQKDPTMSSINENSNRVTSDEAMIITTTDNDVGGNHDTMSIDFENADGEDELDESSGTTSDLILKSSMTNMTSNTPPPSDFVDSEIPSVVHEVISPPIVSPETVAKVTLAGFDNETDSSITSDSVDGFNDKLLVDKNKRMDATVPKLSDSETITLTANKTKIPIVIPIVEQNDPLSSLTNEKSDLLLNEDPEMMSIPKAEKYVNKQDFKASTAEDVVSIPLVVKPESVSAEKIPSDAAISLTNNEKGSIEADAKIMGPAVLLRKDGNIIRETQRESIEKISPSATGREVELDISSELDRLRDDMNAVKSSTSFVKVVNEGDALRDARAVVAESSARRRKEQRLDNIPFFSMDVEDDVSGKEMKGAALVAAIVSISVGPNAVVAAVAIPLALFLSNTRGLTGNAVRSFGALGWDLFSLVINICQEVTMLVATSSPESFVNGMKDINDTIVKSSKTAVVSSQQIFDEAYKVGHEIVSSAMKPVKDVADMIHGMFDEWKENDAKKRSEKKAAAERQKMKKLQKELEEKAKQMKDEDFWFADVLPDLQDSAEESSPDVNQIEEQSIFSTAQNFVETKEQLMETFRRYLMEYRLKLEAKQTEAARKIVLDGSEKILFQSTVTNDGWKQDDIQIDEMADVIEESPWSSGSIPPSTVNTALEEKPIQSSELLMDFDKNERRSRLLSSIQAVVFGKKALHHRTLVERLALCLLVAAYPLFVAYANCSADDGGVVDGRKIGDGLKLGQLKTLTESTKDQNETMLVLSSEE